MDEFRGLRQYILKVAKPNVELRGWLEVGESPL
jgi:hypothetical protein